MVRSYIAGRPRGCDGPRPTQETQQARLPPTVCTPAASRKVFNCIVDESALIAGVKHTTRDGIRKWVAQDAIHLYIPLQTVALLHKLRAAGTERQITEATEALDWLDKVTSDPQMDGRVVLENPEEQFKSWEEVEKFLLPESLFSEEVSSEEDDEDSHYGEDLDDSLANLALSDGTSVSSSHSHEGCPPNTNSESKALKALRRDTVVAKSPLHSARPSTDSLKKRAVRDKAPLDAVPEYLRPLFNHVLWRINMESNPYQALESFILLTNDAEKQAIAKKFGIRAKPLEQLRNAVAQEDREFRNHQAFNKIEAGEHKPAAANGHVTENGTRNGMKNGELATSDELPRSSAEYDEAEESDEDVVVFRPQAKTNGTPVYDPNDFGRGPPTPDATARATASTNAKANISCTYAPAGRGASAQRGARGGRGNPTGASTRVGRGAPAPRGGRGNAFVPQGTYTPPGKVFRGNTTHGGRGSVSPRLANRTPHAPPANTITGGRGTPGRGSQNQAPGNRPTSSNGTPRGGATANGSGRGAAIAQPPLTDEHGRINPDSYARPPPALNSLRGGRRKLWEPN